MEIVFLGYKDLNFKTDDGKLIDGIKISYYFPAASRGCYGLEVGSYFFDRSKADVCAFIKKLAPLTKCYIDLVFNGKSTNISNIRAI